MMKFNEGIGRLIGLFILLTGIAGTRVEAGVFGFQSERAEFDTLGSSPSGVLQFYPAAFVSERVMKQYGWELGDVALLHAPQNTLEVRVFPINRPDDQIALHSWLLDTLSLTPGSVKLSLEPFEKGEWSLEPERWQMYMTPHYGNRAEWDRFVVGAPHGDCDLYTSEIVQLMNNASGLPALSAYHYRISYYGRWIDVNRPLARLPRFPEGVMPERVFWEPAADVSDQWQQLIHDVAGIGPWESLNFYTSFHGHDQTLRQADGTRISKNVVEAMGSGFTLDQLRRFKEKYNQWAPELFTEPPLLVFGNLPEDRRFSYLGIDTQFFYSGFGARQYGALRRDLSHQSLHIETPNSLRYGAETRQKTAVLFNELFEFVRDSLLTPERFQQTVQLPEDYGPPELEWVTIPAGEFPMGAPTGEGWSAERPIHNVRVSEFRLANREVTLAEYADYLNEVFQAGEIVVRDGRVYDRRQADQILFALKSWKPLSRISYQQGRFLVDPGQAVFPVFYVSWYGAKAFCNHYGYRLPTEAEWEYAAGWDPGAGRKWRYATGGDRADAAGANFANSGDPFEQGPYPWITPVGYYAENSEHPWNLVDMCGNVAEWCEDWYEYGYYNSNPPAVNPTGPAATTMKTFRGGSWAHEEAIVTTSFRVGMDPNLTMIDVGFRCVRPNSVAGE